MSLDAFTQKIIALGNRYDLPHDWLKTRPHLFSPAIIDLCSSEADTIKKTICTIEKTIALPAFKTAISLNDIDPINPGVLFSYDFHLTPEGPKLIEINTNAGGIFFMMFLQAVHKMRVSLETSSKKLVVMFLQEWKSKYPKQTLNSVAIVDHQPEQQYFYPEFLLFQKLLQAQGIHCIISDPTALYIKEKKLWIADTPINFVYNRLTDFYLLQPEHAVLKQAYVENIALVTPHPYAYALYADKRNLVWLSDINFLVQCGVDENTARQLQTVIPTAHLVDAAHEKSLWDTRKQYFFKPVSSYAGKGVYRGKNITRGVFSEILKSNYMVQALAPPSEVQIEDTRYKIDLRAYVYAGNILTFGARLYQGQTTNLRTPGGGFAVVRVTNN